MTPENAIACLKRGEVESGLFNCHQENLHSLVLKTDKNGLLTRVFFADFGHGMQRLFGWDGHFTIGAHNHDKDLWLTRLSGDVWNVDINIGQDGETSLCQYPFKSALTEGKFELGKPSPVWADLNLWPIHVAYLASQAVHTVLITSPQAAWLVEETQKQPTEKFIYSPREDLRLSSAGLYVPMTKSDIQAVSRRLTNIIGEVAAA